MRLSLGRRRSPPPSPSDAGADCRLGLRRFALRVSASSSFPRAAGVPRPLLGRLSRTFTWGPMAPPPPPPQTNNALPEMLVAINLPCASRMQVPEEPQKVKILIKGVVRRKYPLHDQLHTRCAQILYGSEALTTIPLHSNLGLTVCGTRETGHGTRDTDTGQGAGDTGRETGLGTWDTGQGKQDTGHGTQDTGRRTQDARRDTGHDPSHRAPSYLHWPGVPSNHTCLSHMRQPRTNDITRPNTKP